VYKRQPADRQGILGYVNQWTKETGTRVVPASESLFTKDKQLREDIEEPLEFKAPPVLKRTHEQRLDSMVKRLMAADPKQNEAMLKEIAGEYWRAGAPVTVDQLRTVAAHFLNIAERKAR
jgi:hypothetical protein